ncbi:uncharacterized protein LOC107714285 [Sinocyclocheilus rhinocerous]|uniref:uncharacterized protein LOC107714285 n=1 Tax=Sinocyclocheilus rhinocerous TaxID=307959 RepID=UPI0007B85099|nr:PREDICTED: uncharacterized protein LOC107714285 [Sinocyclocheilus rhinocerous]
MTIRDRNLIISNFTARDAGTYRVLDSDGDLLITVKVRVSSTASAKSGSKGELNNTNDDKPNDTEKHKTSTIPVKGEKGGNVTLTCEYEAKDILDISLNSRSENIDVCQDEECSVRVFKEGNCDVVIKNLSFSDAGKYYLHVYYNNDQTELERLIRTYQLHIHDEISVSIGEQLELDVLLSEADKVQHQSRRSTEWMKVWSRSDGVQSERITIRDRNLIISNFTARDAGTYRVLDSEGEILITVTVTESGKQSTEKLDDTEQHSK